MFLYVLGMTQNPNVVLDYAEMELNNGDIINLTWSSSDVEIDEDGRFDFTGDHVMFDSDDGTGEHLLREPDFTKYLFDLKSFNLCMRDKDTEEPDRSFAAYSVSITDPPILFEEEISPMKIKVLDTDLDVTKEKLFKEFLEAFKESTEYPVPQSVKDSIIKSWAKLIPDRDVEWFESEVNKAISGADYENVIDVSDDFEY
jgi:hypothetical protein